MKVRIDADGGYVGLTKMQFPIIVEVERHSDDYQIYYIAYDELAKIPGFFWDHDDCYKGNSYVFFDVEVTVVEEEEVLWKPRTLDEAFGAHPSPEAEAASQRAADLSMQDMLDMQDERKLRLMTLILDYGIAINDGCYESECGSLRAMEQCHEEEIRLMEEITKMIQEGV